jgi:hypothetical protein
MLPLVELATLQSLVCESCSGLVWVTRNLETSSFPKDLAVFHLSPSPATFVTGSSSPELTSPSEFSGPYPPPVSRPKAPSLGFSPLRDVNQRSPRSRASQARFVPSSGFLTPSTACSSTGLVGLFHPTATSGIHPSGIFPPSQPCPLVGGRCPHGVSPLPLPSACANSASEATPPSGPCSAPESVASRRGLAHAPPASLLGFASSRFSLSYRCHRFHGSSAHDLHRRTVQARSCDRPTAFHPARAQHISLEMHRPARGFQPASQMTEAT